MGDIGPRGEDDAGAFVAEDVVGGYDASANHADFPVMKIGAEEKFSRVRSTDWREAVWLTYPQMPFARTCTMQSSGPRIKEGDDAL
jgi:hypothetical protein